MIPVITKSLPDVEVSFLSFAKVRHLFFGYFGMLYLRMLMQRSPLPLDLISCMKNSNWIIILEHTLK